MSVKKLAIYLPQYHSIPENDKAWGEGFTEWINVKKAKSLFEGHYQPHIPHATVGYYDLSDPKVLIKQAALAKENGIHGFAYYHYWFNGKMLLNEPLDNMLKLGKPDFPFCYIWANENWTKRWDGADQEVIIQQDYSFEDDLEHIRYLCDNVFCNERYITIDCKPLFLVYRTELFPDIQKTSIIWREEAKRRGFKDIYLVRVENFVKDVVPESIGFDAAMEFAPDWGCTNKNALQAGNVSLFSYPTTVLNMLQTNKGYPYFRSVFPGWDNTPRRKSLSGSIFIDNNLELFRFFLERQMGNTVQKNKRADEQIIFINAWNEWGEGCHIEPDEINGMGYLDICRRAVPKIIDDAEKVLYNEVITTIEKNNLLQRKYNLLKKQNNHTTNTAYYKAGKLVMEKYKKFKKLFKKRQSIATNRKNYQISNSDNLFDNKK